MIGENAHSTEPDALVGGDGRSVRGGHLQHELAKVEDLPDVPTDELHRLPTAADAPSSLHDGDTQAPMAVHEVEAGHLDETQRLVTLVGDLSATREFGLLAAATLMLALVANLFLLPALLSWRGLAAFSKRAPLPT